MEIERRRGAPRFRFSTPLPVRILAIDGTWCRKCALADASDSGAQLVIDGAMIAAKEFFLMLSSNLHPAFRFCKIVWINGNRMGVAFERLHVPERETILHEHCTQYAA